MTDHATCVSLLDAVGRYFELMFDSDVLRFEQVFASSAQLHGLRDGDLCLLTAQDYRTALEAAPSPKAKNAPRQQEILLVDFASPSQAMVKVRVRIDTVQYIDYLSFPSIKGNWLITASITSSGDWRLRRTECRCSTGQRLPVPFSPASTRSIGYIACAL